MRHRLALDFDDVICDTLPHVLEAFRQAGYPIPSHIHRYEDWDGQAPFSREESNAIVFSATASLELAKRMLPIPGAIHGIQEVLTLGVEVTVLTARGKVPGEIEAARCFLGRFGLDHLPITGTALVSKGQFIDGYTVALDDSTGELLSMPAHVHRLLFRRPRNKAFWRAPTNGIIPVRDWLHVVEVIRDLVR